MAVVQPYFDPTTLLQGGSIFSAYLQGFVKERSAMNRQMMELALAQADPKELYDQLESINKQIEALREFKYEVSTGRASGQQLTSQVVGIFRSAYEAELDRGTAVEIERAKQQGAATIVYDDVNTRFTSAADAASLPANSVAAAYEIIAKTTRPRDGNMGRKAFLNIVEKSQLDPEIKTEIMTQMQATEAEKTEAQTLNRESFIKQYKYKHGGADTIEGAKDVYEVMQNLGVLKSPSSGRPQGLKASDKEAIDKEIKSLEEERKQLKQQLEAARSGNVDIFQSFSGNYGLDNPFINVKTAYVDQPGVFAIASAVQHSKQELRQDARDVKAGFRDVKPDLRELTRAFKADERQLQQDARQDERIEDRAERIVNRSLAQGERQEARQEARERRGEPMEDQDFEFFRPFLQPKKQTESQQTKESVEPQQDTSVRLPVAQVFTDNILNDFKDIQLTEGARKVIDSSFALAEKQLRLKGNTDPTVEELLPIVHLNVQNIVGNEEYPELDEQSLTQLEQIFVGEDETPLNLREIAKARKTAKENQ